MIVLFTAFGADDIDVGQLKAALPEHASSDRIVVDLLHGVRPYHVRAAAHLLAPLQSRFPVGAALPSRVAFSEILRKSFKTRLSSSGSMGLAPGLASSWGESA